MIRKPLVCLALLAASTPAFAQRPITYREALEASLEANPALQRSQISRDQAKANLTAATGTFDPTYNLNANYELSSRVNLYANLTRLDFTQAAGNRTTSLQLGVRAVL